MKKIKMFYKVNDFENFVNSGVDIISTDIKVMEQSASFQESFCAIIYYNDADQVNENTNLKTKIGTLSVGKYGFSFGMEFSTLKEVEKGNHPLYLIKDIESHKEEVEELKRCIRNLLEYPNGVNVIKIAKELSKE